MPRDYYQILGVLKNASDSEINRAYHKLAMQYHPDRNHGNEKWANEKSKEINEAYGVLGDPQKRRQYDQFGTAGDMGDIFSSPFTRTTFQEMMKDLGGAGLRFDFLDEIFGDFLKGRGFPLSFRSFGGRPGRITFETWPGQEINLNGISARPRRSQDLHYELTINRQEPLHGVTKRLKRKGKRLEAEIPAGVRTGTVVRLRNAPKVSDGVPGDILIKTIVR